MWVRCVLTVASVRKRAEAISLFERPRATSTSTSSSRSVSCASSGGFAAPGGGRRTNCSNCSEGPRRSSGIDGGGHPPKRWYEPGEEAPVSLFNHILLDGYVVVTYKPELPEADRTALEEWVTARDIIVAGRPETDQEEMVVASTVRNQLACSDLDIDALTTFRQEWFEARPTEGG
jgi:hypothetical protein